MADNIHEVVQLLAARVESHPEEFGTATSDFPGRRWDKVIAIILPWLTTEEKNILRDVYLTRAHGLAMEELLGERRANYDEQRAQNARVQIQQYLSKLSAPSPAEMRAGLANQYSNRAQIGGPLQNPNTRGNLLNTKK